MSTLAGVAVVKIRVTPLEGWGRIIKRGFDIVGSAYGLLLIAPLLAVIAAVIAVADRRPVLFRQEQIGRAGETFRILKFRTMGTASPAGLRWRCSTSSAARTWWRSSSASRRSRTTRG